ncbi:MAG: 1,3-propanediol dehydrogenase [Deltaproteobacteria bacterium ADurb.BinA179]|jgi:alcohol dehydrogenase class IV|nr:iron-containing alcohol dehydrogenase [Deltaproteobacteria bacterium]MDI9542617.1 iron-containing alcohol dehydrogenase [Pseudomonadota bacterium]NLW68015.1 iron-containing alcohol dehydrogenase [Bacteriovoracaceae bacterium]OPZ30095.1 MAG: 1,3-propanediol dehydrogenase [Deltaproteobacteria bacterium ADurb.BinA179]HNR50268.1 iron-containing alcohol dehydrogenase [Deltaproteobacteria bacterium]
MAYDSDLSFNYFGPTKIVFGVNASRDADIEMGALGGSKAVVVTDKGIIKAGLVDGITECLGGKCAGVFSEVPQDTGVEVVDAAAEFARKNGADMVISVGGGSVIDTAKGMCILLTEGGTLRDFNGVQLLSRPQVPHMVIPTTAGTGSEVTNAAVIMDREMGQKRLLVENFNVPRMAILDPKMTEKLPPLLTASTGMDAMTHAVEAVHSIPHEPITDGLALHAIRLLYRYLPVCVENGSDLHARGQVQIAATMAGWAFGNAMVGIVHAMAHSIGAIAHVPHGIANGILLAESMEFNLEEAADGYAMIAEAMGVREKGMDDHDAARAAISAMREFTLRIGHPQRFSEMGVSEQDIVKAADLSLSDGSIVNNPRIVMDSSEVLDIFQKTF